ncbi:hypothetical protein CU048_12115 [Beijerinckiaceae bacterium]|nr:hypothetical protein CU048_12115 [Beijerinckiaceae bacterium]
MSLKYDTVFIDLFTKIACRLARHPHVLLAVEVCKDGKFVQVEVFPAIAIEAISKYVASFEREERSEVFIHLGAIRPDFAKTRSPQPDDFLEVFGFVTSGDGASIEAAAKIARAQLVLSGGDNLSALFAFDQPMPIAVLKSLQGRIGDLAKRGSRGASTAMPIAGTVAWPTRDYGRHEAEFGKLLRAPRRRDPAIITPVFA